MKIKFLEGDADLWRENGLYFCYGTVVTEHGATDQPYDDDTTDKKAAMSVVSLANWRPHRGRARPRRLPRKLALTGAHARLDDGATRASRAEVGCRRSPCATTLSHGVRGLLRAGTGLRGASRRVEAGGGVSLHTRPSRGTQAADACA